MKNAFSAWLRLTRIDHGAMSAVGVLIGILIMQKASGLAIGMQEFALALLVPICVQIAAFALNDLLDVETDRHNKRHDRPLVNGEISEGVAKITVVTGFALGIVFAFLINPLAGAIALVFSALSIAYDWKLKDLPAVGNAYIAVSMAIAFVFGAAAVYPDLYLMPYSIWLVCAIAYFAGFGREIIKTVQDMEGDRLARKAKTLPIIIGRRTSLRLAGLSYIIFAYCTYLLVADGNLPFMVLSAGLVGISTLAHLAIAFEIYTTKDVAQERLAAFRKASLYALMAGLAGILIASI